MAIPYKSIARVKRALIESMEMCEKSTVILYHLNIAQRRMGIMTEKNWSDPEETAKKVWEQARDHADAMGGPQRFQVNVVNPDDGEVIRIAIFNVDQGLSNDTSDQAGSEPPTEAGLTAMLMRHTQEMSRQHNAAIGALTHHLSHTVEKQADQIDKLMEDRLNTIVVMEDLMSRKHERDLDTKKQEAGLVHKKELMDKLMQLGPTVINKLAGKELVHQKASTLEASIMAFMETIKPHHLDAMVNTGVLDRQQLILFSTVLEQVTKNMVTIDQKKEAMDLGQKAANNEVPPTP